MKQVYIYVSVLYETSVYLCKCAIWNKYETKIIIYTEYIYKCLCL